MRILVLQLARLGDVYLTWPVLRALRRQYPQAQIQLMVRERFVAATQGLERIVDDVVVLPTRDFLEPVLTDQPLNVAAENLQSWIESVKSQDWNQIINLSYSEFSSHLAFALRGSQTQVTGYSRHTDGSFLPVDDSSAYFLAQVGVASHNQRHLIDLFADAAGVQVEAEDLRSFVWKPQYEPQQVAIHLFASSPEKSLSTYQWNEIIESLLKYTSCEVVLLGSTEDQIRLPALKHPRLRSFVGNMPLKDVFSVLQTSRLVIAPDSAVTHMAGLVGTPTLQISFASVNVRETGPWSPKKSVIYSDRPESLDSNRVIQAVIYYLQHDDFEINDVVMNDRSYQAQLIQAIYLGAPFPVAASDQIDLGWDKVTQLMSLALEQMYVLYRDPKNKVAAIILGQIDELLEGIVHFVSELDPVYRWYKTELCRIPPGALSTILQKTELIYRQLLGFSELGAAAKVVKGQQNEHTQLEF